MNLPLTGVRVVDFGQGGAGPYCGQLLGDYGADVVKVEPPRGDWARTMGLVDTASGASSAHISMNRNKRAICLDLGMVEGQAVAAQLASTADVILESFRPGVMDRLGLGYEHVKANNPNVVYCSVTGFGSSGPNVNVPASDSIMQPYGGLMSVIGEPEGPPLRVGNIVSDMLAATNAFAGILLALYQREVYGHGDRVGVSLLDSIIAFQTTGITEYLLTDQVPQRPGNRHPLLGASGVIQATDGYVAFAVLDHYWDAFCGVAGLSDIKDDPRFTTSDGRLINRDALWEYLEKAFAERSVDEWRAELGAIGVVCGPVNDYADLARDAQVAHNELFTRCELDSGLTVPMVRNPIRISDLQPIYGPPPCLGEHTREILSSELDMSDAEIDALVSTGAAVVVAPSRERAETRGI